MAEERNLVRGAAAFLRASLLGRPEESEGPSDLRRRRLVCALTVVVGAGVLAWSLRIPAGDPLFYAATVLLALVWAAGARLSGPLPLRRAGGEPGPDRGWRIGQSLVLGTLLLVVFLAGAVVVAQIPPLAGPVQALLEHSRQGALPLVALITAGNGLCEEMFFRGALFEALPKRWQIAGTTAIYTIVTALSGVPLLALAALLLGLVVALQRRTSGGFLAPTITHLTWSLGMLLLLGPTLSGAAKLLG